MPTGLDGRFSEEEQWAEWIGQGDPGAFKRFYDAYVNRLYRFFYGKVNNDIEAEILTSETLHLVVNTLMSDHYLWQGEVWGQWLFKIANNVLKKHKLASLIEDLERVLGYIELGREGGDTIDSIVQQEGQKVLWQLVDELQLLERQVITLVHKNKLSYAEIGARLSCGERASKQLYYQALMNLNRKIQTYGLVSKAGGG